MKKILIFLGLLLLAVPAWADDDLSPEPQDRAIGEYLKFWQTDTPDPMNHETWKLYVYYQVIQMDGFNNVPETLVTGLTPNPRDHYFVTVRINQLYNFFRPAPLKGDVIVVEGRVIKHFETRMKTPKTDFVLKSLYLYAQGAEKLAGEHFDPYPVVKAVPTVSTPREGASAAATPTVPVQ